MEVQAEGFSAHIASFAERAKEQQQRYKSAWRQTGQGLTVNNLAKLLEKKEKTAETRILLEQAPRESTKEQADIKGLTREQALEKYLKEEDIYETKVIEKLLEGKSSREIQQFVREMCQMPDLPALPKDIGINQMAYSLVKIAMDSIDSSEKNPDGFRQLSGSFVQNALITSLLEDPAETSIDKLNRLWKASRIIGKMLIHNRTNIDKTNGLAQLGDFFYTDLKGAVSAATALKTLQKIAPQYAYYLPTPELDIIGMDAVIIDPRNQKIKGGVQFKSSTEEKFASLTTFTISSGKDAPDGVTLSSFLLEDRAGPAARVFVAPVFVPPPHQTDLKHTPSFAGQSAFLAQFVTDTDSVEQWSNVFHSRGNAAHGVISPYRKVVTEIRNAMRNDTEKNMFSPDGAFVVFTNTNWSPLETSHRPNATFIERASSLISVFHEWKNAKG